MKAINYLIQELTPEQEHELDLIMQDYYANPEQQYKAPAPCETVQELFVYMGEQYPARLPVAAARIIEKLATELNLLNTAWVDKPRPGRPRDDKTELLKHWVSIEQMQAKRNMTLKQVMQKLYPKATDYEIKSRQVQHSKLNQHPIIGMFAADLKQCKDNAEKLDFLAQVARFCVNPFKQALLADIEEK